MNEQKPLPSLALAAAACPLLGVIVWVWTHDYRWAITGFTLMFVFAAIGVFIDSRKDGRK